MIHLRIKWNDFVKIIYLQSVNKTKTKKQNYKLDKNFSTGKINNLGT